MSGNRGKMLRLALVAAVFTWLLAGGAVAAFAQESGATEAVKQVLNKAMEIQTRPDLEGEAHAAERARLIRQLIADNFLTGEMAQEAAPEGWSKASAKQRSEYQDLFKVLFQDSYTQRVLNYFKRETVEYPGAQPEKNGVKVQTVIMRPNEHMPVDYYMLKKGDDWRIRDVDIDGVSIVDTYKSSFRKVIQQEGFDGLLKRLRTQSRTIQGGTGQ